jgi:chloramphenicol-sensitive protein RarD
MTHETVDKNVRQNQAAGLGAAVGAFILWGVLPIYWKLLSHLSPLLIILHRVFWSFIFLLLLMLKDKRTLACLALLKNRRTFLTTSLRSLLLTANWLVFIWAVNNGHIVETSLGYFLNPLMNTLCGALFFKERPNMPQYIAILFALTGVGIQLFAFGRLPWIALSLGSLFAVYGALRKADPVDSISGLFLETTTIIPLISAALLWFHFNGGTGLDASLPQTLLIMSAGVLTSVPLMLFAFSAMRLSLTTVGLVQYIAPSMTMLIGVFIYAEPVTSVHLASFACIWTALLIYSIESLRQYRLATRLNWRD